MIYIILGMHKSGTTLVSKILHESGIYMGEFSDDISYDKGNHYEYNEPRKINYELLNACGKHSLDVFRRIDCNSLSKKIVRRISRLIEDNSLRHSDWGFKDPRTCLTYCVWNNFLGEHKLICIYRDPVEVFEHYLKNIPIYKPIKRLIYGYKALRAWLFYNINICNIIKKNEHPYILLSYNALMNDSNSIRELTIFLERQLVDCRNKMLYRSRLKRNVLYTILSYAIELRYQTSIPTVYYELEILRKRQEGTIG